jgi:hypothetical protein
MHLAVDEVHSWHVRLSCLLDVVLRRDILLLQEEQERFQGVEVTLSTLGLVRCQYRLAECVSLPKVNFLGVDVNILQLLVDVEFTKQAEWIHCGYKSRGVQMLMLGNQASRQVGEMRPILTTQRAAAANCWLLH